MQSTTSLHGVPFRQNPRPGQAEAIRLASQRDKLNIQLPTGYGKTFTNVSIYTAKRRAGVLEYHLTIVPTVAQLQQMLGAARSYWNAGLDDVHGLLDIAMNPAKALRDLQNGKCFAFATTIQSLVMSPATFSTVMEMMEGRRWMICVDEYHHYGEDKSWGMKVKQLPHDFLLAMSATPHRFQGESAFGKPDLVVLYKDAISEGAVKPLKAHSYVFRLEINTPNGVQTLTTAEIVSRAGGDTPEKIDDFLSKVTTDMRQDAGYVSPLVSRPIERMMAERLRTKQPLQVLITTMSVGLARIVCDQVRNLFPGLRVDWVGTGPSAGDNCEARNASVIERFCPSKIEANGRRKLPSLDVLVHVGIAGEGLDSVYVSEVVFLTSCHINNTTKQQIGRAARVISECPSLVGNINFDSCTEYATEGYVGNAIVNALDDVPPIKDEESVEDESDATSDSDDLTPIEIPDRTEILSVELIQIDTDTPDFRRMAKAMQHDQTEFMAKSFKVSPAEIESICGEYLARFEQPGTDAHNAVISLYKSMIEEVNAQFNEVYHVENLKTKTDVAAGRLSARLFKILMGRPPEGKEIGLIKKEVNRQKAKETGVRLTDNVDASAYVRHLKWLNNVIELLQQGELPFWAEEWAQEYQP